MKTFRFRFTEVRRVSGEVFITAEDEDQAQAIFDRMSSEGELEPTVLEDTEHEIDYVEEVD